MAGKDNEWQGALAAIDQSSIDKLKALKSDQDKLSERLQAMDDLKASVPAAVYQRVRDDYVQQLRKLCANGPKPIASRAGRRPLP